MQWNFDNGSKKKIRGIKRRVNVVVHDVIEETEIMPDPKDYGLGYWHLHLPNQDYIDSKKTSNKYRRTIMQLLVNRVAYLKSIRTKEQSDYRIYALISLPYLFDSQLVVIPDKSWFEGYFEKDYEDQKWLPLRNERNIITEWELTLPSDMEVRGFKEIIVDDEDIYESEIWFIGELS